jgi:hypothetical protein
MPPLIDQLTDVALVTSLRSVKCPACGGAKKRGHTLCFREYRALPATFRSALYDRLHHGYREAVLEALQFLDAATFQVDLPEDARG